jgi:uncharacterized protein YdiU (UPF0061 family)
VLAAVSTGERVYRDRQLPGAVLTRVASSHIRVGTFQYFAARGDQEAVERLSDYVIDRHFPEARDAERPRLALLQAVLERQALLIARWMHVGFIHGVMNTDNTALSGETIDFGPCAFMDSYDPATTFSAIDEFGRYAYANQPTIAQWNLARFAETLLPLLDPNPERAVELASEAISAFTSSYQEHWLAVNPAFIPRNHLVENALDAAIDNADFSPFVELLTVLSRPYQDQSAFAEYANPPQSSERVFRTFCGT